MICIFAIKPEHLIQKHWVTDRSDLLLTSPHPVIPNEQNLQLNVRKEIQNFRNNSSPAHYAIPASGPTGAVQSAKVHGWQALLAEFCCLRWKDTCSTVRCQEGCRPELILASNHRHGHSRLCWVLEVRSVSPPKYSVNLWGKAIEPKLYLQVSEAVVWRDPIVVNAVILFCHRHNVDWDLSHRPDGNCGAVLVGAPLHSDAALRGLPRREVAFRDCQHRPIVGELQVVGLWVPCGGLGGLKGEALGPKEEPKGLDPGEVPGSICRPETNEPPVDLEVRVGHQAEVLVALAVEVEDYAIPTDESRIKASSSRGIAVGFPICMNHKAKAKTSSTTKILVILARSQHTYSSMQSISWITRVNPDFPRNLIHCFLTSGVHWWWSMFA